MKKIYLFLVLLSFNAFSAFDHDHKLWSKILNEHLERIDKQTLFNYKKMKKNKIKLKNYLSSLESVSKEEFNKFAEDEKLAFWINAYNAYTIKLIIDHYPVDSIKEINSGLFSDGPWGKEFIKLLGKKMTLDDIEHNTIRKNFNEPRIHFAVNCASMGCPSLFDEAFRAKNLDEQLDNSALNFLRNPSKNKLKGNTLYLSKIFDWYGDDFEKKYGSYIKYIIKTLGLKNRDYDVEFQDYDWELNKTK